MRQPEEMGWYEVEGEDGMSYACHAIKRLVPEGSKEITEAEARQISANVRSRQPNAARTAVASAAAAGVDLEPIQAQIEALASAVIGHAKTLDDHQDKIQSTQTSVATYLQGVKEGKPG